MKEISEVLAIGNIVSSPITFSILIGMNCYPKIGVPLALDLLKQTVNLLSFTLSSARHHVSICIIAIEGGSILKVRVRILIKLTSSIRVALPNSNDDCSYILIPKALKVCIWHFYINH